MKSTAADVSQNILIKNSISEVVSSVDSLENITDQFGEVCGLRFIPGTIRVPIRKSMHPEFYSQIRCYKL